MERRIHVGRGRGRLTPRRLLCTKGKWWPIGEAHGLWREGMMSKPVASLTISYNRSLLVGYSWYELDELGVNWEVVRSYCPTCPRGSRAGSAWAGTNIERINSSVLASSPQLQKWSCSALDLLLHRCRQSQHQTLTHMVPADKVLDIPYSTHSSQDIVLEQVRRSQRVFPINEHLHATYSYSKPSPPQ